MAARKASLLLGLPVTPQANEHRRQPHGRCRSLRWLR